jgi:hypothetical protein
MRHHVHRARAENGGHDDDQRDVVDALARDTASLGARARHEYPYEKRQSEEEPVRMNLDDTQVQQRAVHQSLRRSPTPTTMPRLARVASREVPP